MPSYDENIAALYDRLLRFEQQAGDELTVHKRLRFPQAWQANGIHDINDWLKQELPISAETHLLDAGCGVGGTLFALLAESGHGFGITLSGKQVDAARAAACRLGIQDRIQFAQQSYDAPLDQQFDVIVTIEALAHSADLVASVRNLARMLKPNGRLILVEEMFAGADQAEMSNLLQSAWGLAAVHRAEDYRAGLISADLHLITQHNFTPYVQARRWPTLLLKVGNCLLKWLPAKYHHLLKIYLGGLALETLYATGQMRYQVWIADLEKGNTLLGEGR